MASRTITYYRKDCKYCQNWSMGKCSVGIKSCCVKDSGQLSRCTGCPYGKAFPCVGWCMKDIMKSGGNS